MLIAIVAVVLLIVAALCWRYLKRLKAKHAEDLRRAQDERAEAQTKVDLSATETFTRIREKIVPSFPDSAPLFDALEAGLSKGAVEMVALLRERMQMLKAGLDGVQDQVNRATQNELAVRADNTFLRIMLEKYLALPVDPPAGERDRLRTRIAERLGAIPPNHTALVDAYFRDFAERVAADLPPAPRPAPRPASVPKKTPKKKAAPKKRRSDA